MEGLAKIGPWGGDGGDPQDIVLAAAPPGEHRGQERRRHRRAVLHLRRHRRREAHRRAVGRLRREEAQVKLGEAERVTEVSGTLGPWGDHACVVKSRWRSAGKTHGPFGEEVAGAAFRVPVKGGGRVVGFFARSGWLLDAVGIYVHP
uniref:Jacalin-type lectin domain-containing protein n=1 Tax=Oryza meridionalis TaxID=40149 RepID=A0A0E0DLU4_9ORYZ